MAPSLMRDYLRTCKKAVRCDEEPKIRQFLSFPFLQFLSNSIPIPFQVVSFGKIPPSGSSIGSLSPL